MIARSQLQGGSSREPLLVVPKELIISRANIELLARSDRHLREVLEAIGDFGRVREIHTHVQPLSSRLTSSTDYERCSAHISVGASNDMLS